ncbi:hypothetical protein KIPB_002528 [Kipferlia bialata]|uniref:Helicase ATP-binding domain-containing protein n=1 Tax=Kipferlia bialata TaxID=797122 RepID=A0A9K3GG76_9EUKA|nr:hypothetical protein KIPB_002528 [Kipferlia bialata]|eukprot:g2528.t1
MAGEARRKQLQLRVVSCDLPPAAFNVAPGSQLVVRISFRNADTGDPLLKSSGVFSQEDAERFIERRIYDMRYKAPSLIRNTGKVQEDPSILEFNTHPQALYTIDQLRSMVELMEQMGYDRGQVLTHIRLFGSSLPSVNTLLTLLDQSVEKQIAPIDNSTLKDLDPSFPPFRKRGKGKGGERERRDREKGSARTGQKETHIGFGPSELQNAVLSHACSTWMHKETDKGKGCESGVVVMATGLGKTVLSILLVQRHLHMYGAGYGYFPSAPVRREATKAHETSKTSKTSKDLQTGGEGGRLLAERENKCRFGKGERERGDSAWERSIQHGSKPQFCVLFLVNAVFIRDQVAAKFERHFSEMDRRLTYHTVSGMDSSVPYAPNFVFCLFQSYSKLPESVLSWVTHVVVDECHHCVAPSYRPIIEGLRKRPRVSFMLGCTATLLHARDARGSRTIELFDNTLYVNLPFAYAKRLGLFPPTVYLELLDKRHPASAIQSDSPAGSLVPLSYAALLDQYLHTTEERERERERKKESVLTRHKERLRTRSVTAAPFSSDKEKGEREREGEGGSEKVPPCPTTIDPSLDILDMDVEVDTGVSVDVSVDTGVTQQQNGTMSDGRPGSRHSRTKRKTMPNTGCDSESTTKTTGGTSGSAPTTGDVEEGGERAVGGEREKAPEVPPNKRMQGLQTMPQCEWFVHDLDTHYRQARGGGVQVTPDLVSEALVALLDHSESVVHYTLKRVMVFVSSVAMVDSVVTAINAHPRFNGERVERVSAVDTLAVPLPDTQGGETGPTGDIAHNAPSRGPRSVFFRTQTQDVPHLSEASSPSRHRAVRAPTAYGAHYRLSPMDIKHHMGVFTSDRERLTVLVSVAMGMEGFDLPSVDGVILARKSDSERVTVQQMGRCLRKDPARNKTAVILDVVGSLRRRWRRLLSEASVEGFRESVTEFWPVSELVLE